MCIKEFWGYDVASFELGIGLMVKKVKQRLWRWPPSREVSYWCSLIPIIWPHVDIMIQSSHHNFFHLLVNDLKSWHNSYYSFECSRRLLQWSLVFLCEHITWFSSGKFHGWVKEAIGPRPFIDQLNQNTKDAIHQTLCKSYARTFYNWNVMHINYLNQFDLKPSKVPLHTWVG
jgi:hypothetical protein